MKLSAEQLQRFDRDGYLFFPSLFTPEEIKTLTDEVPSLYAQRRPENVREKTGDVVRTNFAAHLYSYPFAKLARHPRMVEPIKQLFGEDVYMHQFKINGKQAFDGDVWQWHQDYGTWRADDQMPEARAMNVAIFLDEVNEFNGPLMFIPGSHKQGVLDAQHDTSTTSYPLWVITNETIGKLVEHGGIVAPEGSRRLDDPVPRLPGARFDLEPFAVEPRQRLPLAVRGVEPHPPLQAPRLHRAPRLLAHPVPAGRLPAETIRRAASLEERHAPGRTEGCIKLIRDRPRFSAC